LTFQTPRRSGQAAICEELTGAKADLKITSRTILAVVAAVLPALAGSSLLGSAMLARRGYVIAEITVTDADAYKQYAAAVAPIVARFGGR
jgi:hypothetical protein